MGAGRGGAPASPFAGRSNNASVPHPPSPHTRPSSTHLPTHSPGDNLMYPVPYHELSGWNVRSLTCGSSTFACAATYGNEKSTITWGHTNGYRWVGGWVGRWVGCCAAKATLLCCGGGVAWCVYALG